MNPNSREHLSALMDGELGAEPARFLLRRLEHEPELARSWSRWHLVRACLAKDAAAEHADPLRIALAVSHDENEFAARVLQAVQALPQARRHWTRYLGGGAIAASVAAAALILSVPQTTSPDTTLAVAPEHTTTAAARTGMIAAAPVAAKRETAPPWLDSRQPMFLAARPATARGVFGGGLLQPGYLQQAAYAPDANNPILMRAPGQTGHAPYLIMLVPDSGAAAQSPQH